MLCHLAFRNLQTLITMKSWLSLSHGHPNSLVKKFDRNPWRCLVISCDIQRWSQVASTRWSKMDPNYTWSQPRPHASASSSHQRFPSATFAKPKLASQQTPAKKGMKLPQVFIMFLLKVHLLQCELQTSAWFACAARLVDSPFAGGA